MISKEQTLRQLREQLEVFLAKTFQGDEPRGLYEPAAYAMGSGGKRIRPLLSLVGSLMATEELTDKHFSAALAMEVFHNFTLVHDDIMDEAPVRRGQPTVFRKWNTATGILTGDIMLIRSFEYLARAGDRHTLAPMMDIFLEVASGVCEGQQLDMDFEREPAVSWADYQRMIYGKTAILLRGCLEIGAVAAGMDRDRAAQLGRSGGLMGMAFQLEDDWLDCFGDPARTGKQPGGDILRRKKTALYALTFEFGDEATRMALAQLFHQPTDIDDIQRIEQSLALYNDADAASRLKSISSSWMSEARDTIYQLPLRTEGKKCLNEIIDALVGRPS